VLGSLLRAELRRAVPRETGRDLTDMPKASRRVRVLLCGVAVAAAATVAGAGAVLAYPPIGAAVTFSAGCSNVSPGTTCAVRLCVVASGGQAQAGVPVSVASSRPRVASVRPSSASTGADGCAHGLVLGTGPDCGAATLTATSPAASAQTVVDVACPGAVLGNAAVIGGVAGAVRGPAQPPAPGGGAQPSPGGGGGGRPPRTGGSPPASGGGAGLPFGLVAGVPGGLAALALLAVLLSRAGLLARPGRSMVLAGVAQGADEVVPGLLIGSAPDARRRARLAAAGVAHVVDLRSTAAAPQAWPDGVSVERFPLEDGAAPALDALDALVARIEASMAGGVKVLVHCTGGLGRAATLAIALLVRRGYTLPHAYRLVRDKRPQVAPSDAQLAALTEYARRLGRDAEVPSGS